MDKLKINIDLTFIVLCLYFVLSNETLLLINYMAALSLHECAHYFVFSAKRYPLKSISFTMAGVSMTMNGRASPKDEMMIALAGPLANIAISIICVSLWWVVPTTYFYTEAFVFCNMVLGIFNILPIYPLDGYTVWKSIFYRISNKSIKTISIIINILFSIIFIIIYILYGNLSFVILAVFFAINIMHIDKESAMYFFYYRKKIDKPTKMKLVYIPENYQLLTIYKRYNNKTIFVYNNKIYTYQQLLDLSQIYTSNFVKNLDK